MKTKEKQKRWSIFFIVLAMIMVANMVFPTTVGTSEEQIVIMGVLLC